MPPGEAELLGGASQHWQERRLDNNYDLRQDRFTPLADVPVTGTVPEYRTARFGHVDVTTVPTPGHTAGSVSYLVDLAGTRVAFTGDLIYAPGKVWSAAALQWAYTTLPGATLTMASLTLLLREHRPDLLLPSHGHPMTDPARAIEATIDSLHELVETRLGERTPVLEKVATPFTELSPHLLMNRTSESRSYVLLSDSGTALVIDYGYDLSPGIPIGGPRSAVRPWLPALAALRRDYGIEKVEVAIPTHYHDDHVAAFNLLREVEGTEVWAGAPVAAVLERPGHYDLPCLWYDAIRCERHVPDARPFRWREYELSIHDLPGHTLYASAIAFEADGRRVLATGDQQDGGWQPGLQAEIPNFQYANGFEPDDYARSAALYRRLEPELMISGHWAPRVVTPEYLDMLAELGERVASVHRRLLPLDEFDFGTGLGTRITPYRISASAGEPVTVTVGSVNPFGHPATVSVRLAVPPGWRCTPPVQQRDTAGRERVALEFELVPVTAAPVRRARIAADLSVGGHRFGQQAEALVDVEEPA